MGTAAQDKHDYDLVIRQGLIVDGNGGEPYVGDVAVSGGRIAAVGEVPGTGSEEIDATGALVTPGFVDPHTHYDGQAIWSDRLTPSSQHGVTTVVVGNCGVGFAPCRPGDRDLLINAMEGVEDIPGVVMVEGLSWEWESFPEFLDAIERRPHDIDLAAYVPHSALRVFVMGERGANRDPATDEDIARMVELVGQAMDAGAIGFATSRITIHRRIDGEFIPSFEAAEREVHAIAKEVGRRGGIFQIVPELTEATTDERARADFDFVKRISKAGNVTVTFTIAQPDYAPHRLAQVMQWVEEANREEGVCLKPQLFPRPVGMILGFHLSANPFMECASYKEIAGLPFEAKIAALRQPELRARICDEAAGEPTLPLMALARKFDKMFALTAKANYEPDPETSVEALARGRNVSAEHIAYDLLMEKDGQGMLLVTIANYSHGTLDDIRECLLQEHAVLGLGDGGAHYGLICDASYPTFMLSHWVRDRPQGRLPVADTVRAMSKIPAGLMGLHDRGELAVGKKADINIIDLPGLTLHTPEVKHDLPAGGKRLHQSATGYRVTLVNGKPIQKDGVPTGELPGRLVRFGQEVAAA
jgi:N-acyl-D-amino-acid deacylase